MKAFNPNPIAETLQYTVGSETFGVTLKVGHYGGGRPALTLESTMGRVAVATFNLPDAELPKRRRDRGSDHVKARLVKMGPNFPRPGKDVAA